MALTQAFANEANCPEGKHHVIYWDDKLKGFGLRVTAKGARSWIVDYRCNGRQRRYTIGSAEVWKFALARDEARKIKREASIGIDAFEIRHSLRDAPTIQDLWEKYEKESLIQRPKSQQADVRTMWIKDILPALHDKKVIDIKYDDIDRLHRKITDDNRPVRANRIIDTLRRVFNLAIRWEWIDKNPTRGLKRNPEYNRERYLTVEEIKRLNQVLNNYHNRTSAEAIQMLLLTGARRGEVLNMRWNQLDLDNGIWTKPPNSTKQRKTHRVVLNGPAIALLKRRQSESKSEWVFPGRRKGEPLRKIDRAWDVVRKEAGLVGQNHARMHDLRHSYASLLINSGVPLAVIGGLLGHSQPSTTARYAHLLDEVQRAATDKVGALFESESVEAVPLKR